MRDLANAHVEAMLDLDPLLGTELGMRPGADGLPDLSPAGQQAADELARRSLAGLDAAERAAPPGSGTERRCARLLRERLTAGLALSDQGEFLRAVSNIFAPVHRLRQVFLSMPTATAEDWAVVARRMARVDQAVAGYRASLAEGARRGLFAAPRQVHSLIGQLGEWTAAARGRGWFAEFAADGTGLPPELRADLDRAAASASAAVAGLCQWLADEYLPGTTETPDGAGEDRYRVCARYWTGADLDAREAYAWGWSQYQELREQMREQAQLVLPGASAAEAMRYLDEHGPAVEGVEQIRARLQQMLDQAVADLNGTHFDLAEPIRTVEARIAPPGSAAAPYYTQPAQGFSRPGRTWLPTLGRTRFPLWDLVSTWYHEGVPGHHLQFAQWTYLSGQLSVFQTSVGGISACTEGWALYAERLMDELGYLGDPGFRLGYLDAQSLRAIRVVVDIGMHLRLTIPADSPQFAGQTWTPELALEFAAGQSGRDRAFLSSEIVRYLGAPGQAISYKLGERAWLAGRAAARSARGAGFDLKSWHMGALSLGPVGLDDLSGELASL